MKLITAGYYDDKDDSLHVLSDKDSEVFRKMIVSIIVSTNTTHWLYWKSHNFIVKWTSQHGKK